MRKCRGGDAAILLSICATLAPRARAQVNVEPLRREIRGGGLGAHVAESIATSAGNSEGVSLGLSALIGGGLGRHFGYASASADYAHLNGETQKSKAFVHVRHNYELAPSVWSELFAQVEADRFRHIALRELLGAGPRFELAKTDDATLFWGSAYMLEYTRLNADSGSTSQIAHRFSNYAALVWDAGPMLFSETLYLQPRFDEFSDLRVLSVTNLEFKLTPRLSSRVDATARYDTRQPLEVKPFDLEVKNVLDLRL